MDKAFLHLLPNYTFKAGASSSYREGMSFEARGKKEGIKDETRHEVRKDKG
jgi:hypothetical protein